MRINKIRFKNLNSLYGEWMIDLTDNSYISDGIFAITGPTGAGKTSILDAICLALYGQTPRLNKITRSTNDIMSRQTGECFAELTFEIQDKVYLCFWCQRRARYKADGELQNAIHELTDLSNGQIIKGLANVPDEIKKITSMNFEEFTRSMLLAQGGFSAFLQASPNDRSPILEQITGTEIYSKISKLVHLKNKEEQDKLSKLRIQLEGITLLTDDDISALNRDLKDLQKDEVLEKQKTDQISEAILWLKQLAQIKYDIEMQKVKETNAQKDIEDFKTDKLLLEKAKAALEHSAIYNELKSHRTEINQLNTNLAKFTELSKQKEDQLKQQKILLSDCQKSYHTHSESINLLKPLLQTVRALDVQISERDVPLDALKKQIISLNEDLSDLTKKNDLMSQQFAQMQSGLNQTNSYLTTHQEDNSLSNDIGGITYLFDEFQKVEKESKKDESIKTKIVHEIETLNNAINKLTEEIRLIEEKRVLLKTDSDKIQEDTEKILQGKTYAEFFNSVNLLKDQKQDYHKIYTQIDELKKKRDEEKEINESIISNQNESDTLKILIEKASKELDSLSVDIQVLEENFKSLQQIQSFEESRKQLKDGSPCPLCGSTEHPFAKGNIPVLNTTQALLKQKKTAFEQVLTLKNQYSVQQKTLENDQQKNRKSLINIQQFISDLEKQMISLTTETDIEYTHEFNISQLTQKIETVSFAISNSEKQIKLLETFSQSKSKNDKLLEEVITQFTLTTNQKTEFENQQKVKEQQVNIIVQSLQDLVVKEENIRKEIHGKITKYGYDDLDVLKIGAILKMLVKRDEQWRLHKQSQLNMEKEILRLDEQLKALNEKVDKTRFLINDNENTYQLKFKELEDIQQKRLELFNDKNPDLEEKEAENLNIQLKNGLEKQQTLCQQIINEIEKLYALIEAGNQQQEVRQNQLIQTEYLFLKSIRNAGFQDENTFLNACMSEEKRHQLEVKVNELDSNLISIRSLINELTYRLDTEEAKKITDKSFDELEHFMKELNEKRDEILAKSGAIKEKLKQNDILLTQQKAKITAFDKQNKESLRWKKLHDLIGSADGKKFRNFAQGLTFDYLIHYANEHLEKMSDRYLLIRDDMQSLELSVLDNYQAGEIRSSKNLSGGESFIVSLCLALGLSQMVSNRIRIDSLFLDEGFGTLDEDALDTALNTLASLRHDNKLIGIISHVINVKERILTQIQVRPLKSGKSIINGPGCQQIKE